MNRVPLLGKEFEGTWKVSQIILNRQFDLGRPILCMINRYIKHD